VFRTYFSSAVANVPPGLAQATNQEREIAPRMYIFLSVMLPFQNACFMSDLNTVTPSFTAIDINNGTSVAFITRAYS
jgi:hypothetical protein